MRKMKPDDHMREQRAPPIALHIYYIVIYIL